MAGVLALSQTDTTREVAMLDLIPVILLTLIAVYVLALVAFTYYRKVWAEKRIPPRGAFTTISTGRLHYVDCGSGPAILLIHDLDGNLGHFDCGMIDNLARDHRVIAVDRPGSGYSERAASAPATIRAQARQMAELITKLEIERPVVVGHAFGGAVALALAVERPELVRGLALLSPLTLVDEELPDIFSDYDISSSIIRTIRGWTVAVPHVLRHPEHVVEVVFGPERIPPEFLIRGGGFLSARPQNYINASRDFIEAEADMPGLIRDYSRLAVPVRILFGQDDRILNPDFHGAELATRYPQFGVKMTAGGHMLPITQADTCADFVRSASEKMQGLAAISRASPEVYR